MSPKKVTYTRDEVSEAALAVVRAGGASSLTARAVAMQLGTSTAPVYRQFSSMAELEREVCMQARNLMFDHLTKPYSPHVFLNMGIGMVLFAREEGSLYGALFLRKHESLDVVEELMARLSREMKREPLLAGLTDGERMELLEKMWVFTHGLSSLLTVGLLRDRTQQDIVSMLSDVGSAVMAAVLARHSGAANAGDESSRADR